MHPLSHSNMPGPPDSASKRCNEHLQLSRPLQAQQTKFRLRVLCNNHAFVVVPTPVTTLRVLKDVVEAMYAELYGERVSVLGFSYPDGTDLPLQYPAEDVLSHGDDVIARVSECAVCSVSFVCRGQCVHASPSSCV